MANFEEELIIPLMDGRTLRCGEGEEHEWGSYIRICDQQGNELFFWDKQEWADDPEGVIGAIFGAAVMPITEIPGLQEMLPPTQHNTDEETDDREGEEWKNRSSNSD